MIDDSVTPDQSSFIMTFRVTENDKTIIIPINDDFIQEYDYTIYYGDGTKQLVKKSHAIHVYDKAGEYDVKISGIFPAIRYGNIENYNNKLYFIKQWGNIVWKTMEGAFKNCSKLRLVATDVPDLSHVTTMSGMFQHAVCFTGDLSQWDVSNVKDMNNMFALAESFDGDISQWDVSNVTQTRGMFFYAKSFTGDISNWNVGRVTDMSHMFEGTISFNRDLSHWDVGRVTDTRRMFGD